MKAADGRCFEIRLGGRDTTTDGTVHVDGTLSLEDALDLDAAVTATAKTLRDLGYDESLDVRRSMAVGEMARTQLTLDLTGALPDATGAVGGGRGVTIYAHLDPDSLHATLDNPGAGDALISQVQALCQAAGTVVTIRPVIDLNTEIATDAYTPTGKLVEQVRLRDQCCVFPGCTRRGVYCDLDHRVPYDHDNPDKGGSTATSNLALLCRRHHRAKTFSAWAYESPSPGVYDWTSPSGARFRVVRGGRHGRLPVTTQIPPDGDP